MKYGSWMAKFPVIDRMRPSPRIQHVVAPAALLRNDIQWCRARMAYMQDSRTDGYGNSRARRTSPVRLFRHEAPASSRCPAISSFLLFMIVLQRILPQSEFLIFEHDNAADTSARRTSVFLLVPMPALLPPACCPSFHWWFSRSGTCGVPPA